MALLAVAPGDRAAPAEEPSLDASGLPAPAWQTDPALAEQWRRLTGRYIFQRACVDCHDWGPDRLSRAGWEGYLDGFPGNHEPGVAKLYRDLTAQFLPGDMVPNADQRTGALATFLLSAAPETAAAEPAEEAAPWDGLPRVGDPVPDFRLVDLAGRGHSPAAYRGKQRLVLVFSRAHW